ncbi:MAG: PQQ-binding-like beta-propeller repeat protein [Pirellulaceae bacterium]|nr:PQQ-binding-like beta-propeller repeat protein [Pirellulaceae bacterium]
MKNQYRIPFSVLMVAAFLQSPLVAQEFWAFRGLNGGSVSAEQGLPVEIGPNQNLAWKIELPGRGPSSPIVVGDRVFVTSSGGPKEDQLFISCFAVRDGALIWQRRFLATGRCFCHPLSANAAPTPCTDGESIFAFFSSNDLFCLDLDGNLKWCRGLAVDHPKAGHDTGMSSSPAVQGDILVCQVENQGDSFATAIDKRTGKTIWEIERDKDASWASPLIFEMANQRCCLLQSAAKATIVNLETGETLWEKEGRGNPIPSSAIDLNRIYIPLDGLTVVEFGEDGIREVMNSTKLAAGSQSNVVANGMVYTFGRGGIVTCASAATGDEIWKTRVGGQHWTTPLLAGGHLYFFSQDGTASVLQVTGDFQKQNDRLIHAEDFEDEVFLGSPAAANGALFMRSDRYLYKFSKDPV